MTKLFADLAQRHESPSMTRGLWVRRAMMGALCVVIVLALLDVFGQSTSEVSATAPAAALHVIAPKKVRGGLMFQARIDIQVLHDIQHPRVILDRGWFEGLQINSVTPQPSSESSRGDQVVLSYDQLAAGDTMRIWAQFQVDPTYPGRRAYGVELDDAEQPLVRVHRNLTVLP